MPYKRCFTKPRGHRSHCVIRICCSPHQTANSRYNIRINAFHDRQLFVDPGGPADLQTRFVTSNKTIFHGNYFVSWTFCIIQMSHHHRWWTEHSCWWPEQFKCHMFPWFACKFWLWPARSGSDPYCWQNTGPRHHTPGWADKSSFGWSSGNHIRPQLDSFITWKQSFCFEPPVSTQRITRQWSEIDHDGFRQSLISSVLNSPISDSATTDDLFDSYESVLQDLADRFAPPIVTKGVRRQKIAVWFDNESRTMRRQSRLLERRYRRTKHPHDRLAWVQMERERHRVNAPQGKRILGVACCRTQRPTKETLESILLYHGPGSCCGNPYCHQSECSRASWLFCQEDRIDTEINWGFTANLGLADTCRDVFHFSNIQRRRSAKDHQLEADKVMQSGSDLGKHLPTFPPRATTIHHWNVQQIAAGRMVTGFSTTCNREADCQEGRFGSWRYQELPPSFKSDFVEINWAYGMSTINCLLGETRSFAKISVRIPWKSLNRDCSSQGSLKYSSSQGSLKYIDGCWHWNGLASRFVGHVSSIWHCRSWYSDLPARDIIRHHGHGSRLASVLPDETNTTGCLQWSFIIQGHSRLWRPAGISPGTIAFPPLFGWYPFNCFRAPYSSSLLCRRWATLPVRKGCWGGINDLKGHGMHCWYRHLDVFLQIETQLWQNPVYLAWKQISASKLLFSSASAKLNSNPMWTTLEWL